MTGTKNQQINYFLDYYYKLASPPQYAVMIRGRWGSGKTWFVQRSLERLRNAGGKALYVSLYGVSSVKQIEDDFFRQLHPVLASKGMELAGKVAKGLLKGALKIDLGEHGHVSENISAGLPDISLPDYLTKTEGMLLVFDDVERCSLPIGETLGYINYFVEHGGYKAVLIANEEEIDEQYAVEGEASSEYGRIREKLIGKTFEIEAELSAAVKSFVDEIEEGNARNHIEKNLDTIYTLYRTSDYRNLRHLRQALLDFARIFALLEVQHQQHDAVALHLLTLFLIYSFELKSGNLKPTDLQEMRRDSFRRLFRAHGDQPESAIERAEKKYTSFLPRETLLPDAMWAELMSTGLVDRTALREAVRTSGYFPKAESDWVRLWNATLLDDEAFDTVKASVAREFANNGFTDPGILLHVTGILLSLAERGLYEKSRQEIRDQAIKNANTLKSDGALKNGFDASSYGGMGYAGLGYQASDFPEFSEVASHLRTTSQQAQEDAYPDDAQQLFQLISTDPQKFARSIMLSNHAENRYYNVPIFAFSDVSEFVAQVLPAPASTHWTVQGAFNQRYSTELPFLSALTPEYEWLKRATELLAEEALQRKGKLSGERLTQLANELNAAATKLKPLRSAALNGVSTPDDGCTPDEVSAPDEE
ncbi:UNVERIFIED_ORG: hypothetical protein J2Y81_008130 [Paraburkholderia sediminicola]|nr:hypothetical protein [Paraburkholderia sediminicola]